jgi:threonine synthase
MFVLAKHETYLPHVIFVSSNRDDANRVVKQRCGESERLQFYLVAMLLKHNDA